MIQIKLPLVTALFILLLGSCKTISTSTAEELEIWVNSFKVKCSDVGTTHCLLIQKGDKIEEKSWEHLYDDIQGFQYETGYIYKLRVRRNELENVAANGSKFIYKLVEVLKKKSDPLVRLHDIWLVRAIRGTRVKKHHEPFVRLDLTKGIVRGHDSCNNFKGNILKVDGKLLEFDFIAVTRKTCPNMITSNAFQNAIKLVRRYKHAGDELHLLSEEGEVVLVLRKAKR